MPGGVSGVHLARAAGEIRPDLKILLTSGYIGERVVIRENEFPLIDKPYERAALAARLREILDAAPQSGRERQKLRSSA